MDQESLVEAQKDAGKRFLSEFNKFAPVKFAAWLKETDSGRWYLYVISDAIDDTRVDIAYGEVLRISRQMDTPRIDPFRIRVIGANTSTAVQVLGVQQRYGTDTTPPPWNEGAGGAVEDAFLYPLPIS